MIKFFPSKDAGSSSGSLCPSPVNSHEVASNAGAGAHAAACVPHAKSIAMAMAALGVVYGDIGTSPLYAVKECFHGLHAIAVNEVNVLGVISLILWSLTMVVTVKYVTFIMKADNKGEGGIYALLALVPSQGEGMSKRLYTAVVVAGIFGAALLYGDGIITPAISVLSAVEGLQVATEAAAPYVVPLTCVVLFLLFLVQKHGTAGIGKIFGPIMLLWFAAIAALGVVEILSNPIILNAINPIHAVHFFTVNKIHGMVVLGSVVLCITGGEALYADLGHFGAKPIRISWLSIACPALLLNYLGAGSASSGPPRYGFQSLLRSGSPAAALPHGGPLHCGDGHRIPGNDHRSVFPHAAGCSTGFLPPRAYCFTHPRKPRGRSMFPRSITPSCSPV